MKIIYKDRQIKQNSLPDGWNVLSAKPFLPRRGYEVSITRGDYGKRGGA